MCSDLSTYFVIGYSVGRNSGWWWLNNRQSQFRSWTRVSIQLNQSPERQQRLSVRLLLLFLLAGCVEFQTSELDYGPTPERGKLLLCPKSTDIILRNFSFHTNPILIVKRFKFNAFALFWNPNLCSIPNDVSTDSF